MSRRAWFLIAVVSALLGVGLVFLYSATAARCEHGRSGDAFFFFRKQLLWTVLSVAAMLVAAHVPTRWWERAKVPLLVAAFVLLGLVLVPGVGRGREGHGAQRWLDLRGMSLQPSEAAKLALALFLCSYAAADPQRLRTFFRGFLPTFGALAIACALIAKQPDAGTAIFLGLTMGLVLFAAGVRLLHLLPGALAATAAGGWYFFTHMEHVRARIQTWLHPDHDPLGKGLQVKQSLVALGSGGLWGEGLGRGLQKLYYLPEVHADFLFPVIGEEVGFVGAAGVLLLYVLLGVAGWRIARNAKSPFGFLFPVAMTWLILLQAALNVAVVTATVPAKGIPLPLLSFGGSSLFFTMIGIGVIVRIADEGEGNERPAAPAQEPVRLDHTSS
ncbi:MAG: putative lipid II flippase FtsW [Planctomycetes bacterium]|nr:putative lipid II flippase FtsW [Planctomycetota bacterium]